MSRYTLYGFSAILLWSTTVALTRSLTEQIGPLTAASSVYLASGAFCLLQLCTSRGRMAQVLRLPRRYVLGCGALFILYMLALFLAVGGAADRHQVLEISLINYLWPTFTLVLSLWILNKQTRGWLAPGTVIALFGVLVVLTQSTSVSWDAFWRHVGGNPRAYALALIAAISWGLYSNLTRRWGGAESSGAVMLFLPITGIALLTLRLLTREQSTWQLRTVGEVLFMGLTTTLAYISWEAAIRKGDVTLVAAASYLTPLLSVMTSALYLNVAPGPMIWIGCICIVIGALISWTSISDRGPPS